MRSTEKQPTHSMKKLLVLLALSSLALTATRAGAETYNIDPVHSSVGFSLRHMVSKFSSSFTKVSGTVNFDAAAPEKSSVEATIEIASVNTANEKRDGHLKTPDFFDAAKFPTATFKSKAWKKTGENTFDVTGDLTIKDVTKEIVLKTDLVGSGPGMGGATLVGWEGKTTLKRTDFGVGLDKFLPVLGDDVAITVGIEANHKPAAPAAPAAK
jgi:polyisoprenoid-binding protein YceI